MSSRSQTMPMTRSSPLAPVCRSIGGVGTVPGAVIAVIPLPLSPPAGAVSPGEHGHRTLGVLLADGAARVVQEDLVERRAVRSHRPHGDTDGRHDRANGSLLVLDVGGQPAIGALDLVAGGAQCGERGIVVG